MSNLNLSLVVFITLTCYITDQPATPWQKI